ncbi:MAG: hypothetical protein ABSB95_10620 [Dissulfurispiraceae bacterium]|jgi:hypothetical protein
MDHIWAISIGKIKTRCVKASNEFLRLAKKCGKKQHEYPYNMIFHITILLIVTIILEQIITLEIAIRDMAGFVTNHKIYSEMILGTILLSAYTFAITYVGHIKLVRAAKKAGLFYYSLNKTTNSLTDAKDFLIDRGSDASMIRILGATGWDTFGNDDSPLRAAIENCNQIEIILLNPLSDIIEQRAGDIGGRPGEYRAEIYKSILKLKSIRDKGDGCHRVTLKFYKRYPTWKFIILDRCLWVQRYPTNTHVKYAPCYAFMKLSDKAGFFDPFSDNFDSLWNSERIGTYNFDTCIVTYGNNEPNENIGTPDIMANLKS